MVFCHVWFIFLFDRSTFVPFIPIVDPGEPAVRRRLPLGLVEVLPSADNGRGVRAALLLRRLVPGVPKGGAFGHPLRPRVHVWPSCAPPLRLSFFETLILFSIASSFNLSCFSFDLFFFIAFDTNPVFMNYQKKMNDLRPNDLWKPNMCSLWEEKLISHHDVP